MADFNDNSRKGSVLMQQALKKLADGDVEGFERDREEANRYFDMFYSEINSEQGKLTQLYGESRNFGIIYNVFEQNIDNLIGSEKGKKIIKEGYELIKNNKILNEQFNIYDLFEKTNKPYNAKDFVNESVSILKKYNKDEIKENNEKFINFIKQNKLDEYVEIPEETENLYEAIEYVILNKKNIHNINEFLKAQNTIVEYIERDKEEINENIKKVTFDNFKEKLDEKQQEIDENINEEEKKLLDMFTNSKINKRQMFENYKRNTLNKINEAMKNSEEGDLESWKKVYENINSKTYSDKLSENIVSCAEMLEICSTIEE